MNQEKINKKYKEDNQFYEKYVKVYVNFL